MRQSTSNLNLRRHMHAGVTPALFEMDLQRYCEIRDQLDTAYYEKVPPGGGHHFRRVRARTAGILNTLLSSLRLGLGAHRRIAVDRP